MTDYYPFGLTLSSASASNNEKNKYKLTTKELQEELGLNVYDFGARVQDMQLGKWWQVDPLAEEFYGWSPYNYTMNNPTKLIDPTGMGPEDPNKPGYYSASINSRYIGFGLRHPIAAMRIGFGVTKGASNISTNATRFATRGEVLYGSNIRQVDEGSENGAFRHALWQSAITSEFGAHVAKYAGNTHEENPFADLSFRSFSKVAEADQTVDLLNNIIGRAIGQANRGASMDKLANLVLDEFRNNGLYTATKDKDGFWIVSKTKLSEEKYNQLRVIFKGLNRDGRTKSEQENLDVETQKEREQVDPASDPKL